jgi:hypothetical protein
MIMDEKDEKDEKLVSGVTNPRARALERVPIRTRTSAVTRSAWRLSVVSEQGEGAIVLVEVTPGETLYRGDGTFLGWAQDRLAAAYTVLRPEPEADGFDMQQMG